MQGHLVNLCTSTCSSGDETLSLFTSVMARVKVMKETVCSCSQKKQVRDIPAGQLCMHTNAALMSLLCMIVQALQYGEAQGSTPLWACWLPNMWASSMESSLALPSNLTPATSRGCCTSALSTDCELPVNPCTGINRNRSQYMVIMLFCHH